jgi:hypothetical protein
MWPDNANGDTYGKLPWVTYAYAHTHTFGHAYCHDTTIPDADTELAWITYAYSHCDSAAKSNTKAASDSASSAVTEAVICEK